MNTARIFDFEGQDLDEFSVGDMVELVNSSPGHNFFVPVVGASNPPLQFSVNSKITGIVVDKELEHSAYLFGNKWHDGRTKFDHNIDHGFGTMLYIFLAKYNCTVLAFGPSCDSKRSFSVTLLRKVDF